MNVLKSFDIFHLIVSKLITIYYTMSKSSLTPSLPQTLPWPGGLPPPAAAPPPHPPCYSTPPTQRLAYTSTSLREHTEYLLLNIYSQSSFLAYIFPIICVVICEIRQ